MNIVESIKEDINQDLMSSLAAANGETVEKTTITVETSIISLLLAFMKRASTESGLHLLHTLTNSGNFSLHSAIDSIFPNDKINKLADEGNALISKIIPDKKSPLITFVSSYSGVRNNSANRTNGIVTLLILNKLKQVSTSKSLDLAGLAELFADQKDFLIENAPKNLIEKLSQHIGLGNLIILGSSIITTSTSLSNKNEKQKSTESHATYSSSDSQNKSGGFNLKNWLIPSIFGLILLGAAGFYFYNQIDDKADQEINPSDSLVDINSIKIDSLKPKMLDSAPLNVTGDTLLVEMEEQILPNGQKLILEKGNLDFSVLNFLTDSTKFNTRNLVSSRPTFKNSGIVVLNDPSQVFSNIGAIMKAFPLSRLKITVTDYVGSDSTYSQTFTNKKAFSLKKILMNGGIQPIRIDAIGKVNRITSKESLRAKEVELIIMKK